MTRSTGARSVCHQAWGLFAMARPTFMLGMVPLYAVGVATALHAGSELRWPGAVVGLATVWAVQAMTHYTNEYWDVDVDAQAATSTAITGGSGVLVDQLVSRRAAMGAAVVSLGVAVGLAGTATWFLGAGWPFAVVVAVAIGGGLAYSVPPIRLVGRGVGEVTVGVIAGGLVPMVGYLLQASALDTGVARIVAPLVVLGYGTSLSTALPDVEGDREGGKRTMAVRLGHRRTVGLDAIVLVVGVALFGALVVPIGPTIGAVGLAGLLVPLALFAVSAPAAAHGGPDGTERVAVAGIVTLGIASVATVAVLLG